MAEKSVSTSEQTASSIRQIAVLGSGMIGASWSALFLASGRSVAAYDAAPDGVARLRAYVERAWPTLETLGLAKHGDPSALTFHTDAAEAVADADFVQENAPERLEVKHALYAQIEAAIQPGAVIATSTSGLTLTALQDGFRDPGALVIGHPFNPPHLIPLVEVMGNDRTRAGAVETAEALYAHCGKTTVRVRKEVPGHIANRLQAALWREAIHLVSEGVATVEDVDKAVAAGPGLRWAVMGPNMLFNLAAGDGGMRAFCDHLGPAMKTWWDDLGAPVLTPEVVEALATGVEEEAGGRGIEALGAERDAKIVAMLAAFKDVNNNH